MSHSATASETSAPATPRLRSQASIRSTDGTISTSDTRIDTDANAGFTGVAGRTETATINTTGWAPGTYYIGAIADYNNAITEGNESNNPSSGVVLTVTAPVTDTLSPTLASFTPTDGSPAVAVGANIVLNFNETVRAGTGNIVIYNASGTAVRTIAATDPQVSYLNSQVTINPTSDLAAGTSYYVQIAPGAIRDAAGNSYLGITNATTINFTTASAPVVSDNAGNTFETATLRAVVGTSTGSVGIGADNEDFFRFDATANGRVTVNLTGLSADIDLQALNSARTQIGSGTNGGAANETFDFAVVMCHIPEGDMAVF